jgi:hypothetical protein
MRSSTLEICSLSGLPCSCWHFSIDEAQIAQAKEGSIRRVVVGNKVSSTPFGTTRLHGYYLSVIRHDQS